MPNRVANWLRKRSTKKRAVESEETSPYRAVAISSGLEDCCSKVKELSGQRFLMRSAPALPLKGCSVAQCKCRYIKYSDRRQEPRRGSEYGIASTFVRDVERRSKRGGRRKTD